MKVRLLLKKKGGRGRAYPVYVALYSVDTTEIIYTKEKLQWKEWNPRECAPRDHDSEVYQRIKAVETDILNIKRIMEAHRKELTPYSLKREYEDSKKTKTKNQQAKDKQDKTNAVTVASLVDRWIKTGLGEYQRSTKKAVISSIKTFQTYLKTSGQSGLERKDLTLDIINEYAIYLQDKKKLEDSTHGKKMKHLRWFLKWMKFDSSQVKEIKLRTIKLDERNIIALTLPELTRLENIDVSGNQDQQKAKDMFLLGCYSGLRISDLKRITKPRINFNTRRLTMTLLKNRKLIEIPLIDEAFEILSRYNWSAPKIGEQQVNENIKDVCADAKINEPIYFKSKKAGKLEETLYQKYELITSHVAGKTFISLAGKKWGLTPVDIAAVVGKDVRTVMGYYLKPDKKDAIDKMEKAESERRAQMKVVV